MGKPHEQLEAWKSAMQLAKAVYQLTVAFPLEERYGLAQKMRRAVVLILSNLAEGAGRNGVKEYFYFIGIARGLLAELDTQMLLAVMLGFTVADHAAFERADRTGKLLTGLHKKWITQ